jgi:hypothetical protein
LYSRDDEGFPLYPLGEEVRETTHLAQQTTNIEHRFSTKNIFGKTKPISRSRLNII